MSGFSLILAGNSILIWRGCHVAEEKGKVIGTIGIEKESNEIAKLRRLYVDDKYRGRGIGQRLFDKIIKFSRKKGYKEIILTTYPELKDAIRFYKKNGFKLYKKDKKMFFKKVLK